MIRPRLKIGNAPSGRRQMAASPALVLTANSSTMSLDWIYNGPACDGFHIFVHQPNEAPGTFIDCAQVAGDLRTWATDFDDPAEAAGYDYYIVPMDGDEHPLTPPSNTVSFAAPPVPGDCQGQLDALSARVDAQQAAIDAQQTQITALQTALGGKVDRAGLGEFDPGFSDPPAYADLQNIKSIINDLITAID